MSVYIRLLGRSGLVALRSQGSGRAVETTSGLVSATARTALKHRFFFSSPNLRIGPEEEAARRLKASGYHFDQSSPSTTPSFSSQQDSSSPSPSPRRRGKFLRVALGAAIGFLTAYGLVSYVSKPLPALDSAEDFDKIQAMRLKGLDLTARYFLMACLDHSGDRHGPDVDETRDSWKVIFNHLDVTDGVWGKKQAFLDRALGHSAGVPFLSAICNEKTGHVAAFVYLGPGTSGWPTYVHGGATATVLQTVMELAAQMGLEPLPDVNQFMDPPVNESPWALRRYHLDQPLARLREMDIDYRKTVKAGYFYYIIAQAGEIDYKHGARPVKAVVMQTEAAFNGQDVSHAMVDATGLFLLPKQLLRKKENDDAE